MNPAVFPAVMAWIGILVVLPVLYFRAGLNRAKHEADVDWREFLIPNFPWFVLLLAKSIFWPVTLCVWLAQGRPGTAWIALTEQDGRPVRRIVRAR